MYLRIIECGDLAHLSELESSSEDKMVGVETTCMDSSLTISIEEAKEEVLQEEKIPMVGKFSHESDGGCDFKEKKDATMMTSNNIKKQYKSLAK
nr:hypothetical protein [Tanacetum cinerariifolium]